MDRRQLEEHWAAVEEGLRDVLGVLPLPRADREGILEYLDHNELGLAFDHLGWAVTQTGLEVPAEVAAVLHRIGRSMGRAWDASDQR